MTAYEQAYAAGFRKAAEALGVSPRGLYRRMAIKEASDGGIRAIGNNRLESLGKFTTVAGGGALGAALGKGKGAVIGTLLGLGGNQVSKGVAALTPTRSSAGQADYDKTLKLRNLLVPFLAAYNKSKRLEREAVHKWI